MDLLKQILVPTPGDSVGLDDVQEFEFLGTSQKVLLLLVLSVDQI